MNDLTEQDRKRLTGYLDEKWHWIANDAEIMCECGEIWLVRNIDLDAHENRTFTTPDDFFALKNRLVEKGEWGEFYFFVKGGYAHLQLEKPVFINWKDQDFDDWLINAPRFCWLVSEWLKEKEDEP